MADGIPEHFLEDTLKIGKRCSIVKIWEPSGFKNPTHLLLSFSIDFRIKNHCQEKG
jgi:hypothetical protein